MKKKIVLTLSLMIVFIDMFCVTFLVHGVEAGGTVYINADGSIDPPTANITSDDNVTYTFTDNIYDSIVVERSNIIIDGAEYAIEGSGEPESESGFSLYSVNNVTIKNANIKGFTSGVHLKSASHNTFSGNNITANNYDAIRLEDSSNYNTIFGNKIINNNFDGIRLENSSDHNNIFENYITNNGYGVRLFDSINNSIFGNIITANNLVGVYLGGSSSNAIFGNIITANNLDGIRLYHSSYNSIFGNNITNNGYGIRLFYSSSNMLTSNTMANNEYNFGVGDGVTLSDFVNDVDISNTVDGKPTYYWINESNIVVPLDAGYVALVNCTRITVQNLNLTNNEQGILLAFTANSTITKNNVANNHDGIQLWYSLNNKFCHNNFRDNTQHVNIPTSGYPNFWDDGYPSGGNYWSDYTDVDHYNGPYQNETGSDLIWDHPYVIDDYNQDNYPRTPTHDIAIIGVTASPESVRVGETVIIVITIKNEGDLTETFNVVAYYDSTEIDMQTVTELAPIAQETLTFIWNTSGLDVGNYTIKAAVANITGETDTTDNTLTDGIVVVKAAPVEYRLAISIGDWTEYTVKKAIEAYYVTLSGQEELKEGDKLKIVVEDKEMEDMFIGGEIVFRHEVAVCDVYLNDEKIADNEKQLSPSPFWAADEGYYQQLEDYMEATVDDYDIEISGDSVILTLTIYGTHEQLTVHKESGVLMKAELSSSEMEMKLVLSDTSVPSVITPPSSLLIEWWFWIIVVTGVAVLAGVLYFLKKHQSQT